MDFSHPILVRARTVGRRLGILVPLLQIYYRWRRNNVHEERFERAVLSHILPGDIVWDVGANIGHYTKIFANIVGASGHVVAFEPSPQTFATLSAEMARNDNVTLANVALSNFEGHTDLYVRSDGFNPADGLSTASVDADAKAVPIPVTTGDRYIAENAALAPNRIKIDVEGFESEVLSGLASHLRSEKLKTLFIEFHFGLMAARGLVNEPRGITKMLRQNSFVISWTDPSHICAHR